MLFIYLLFNAKLNVNLIKNEGDDFFSNNFFEH